MTPNKFLHEKGMLIYVGVMLVGTDGKKVSIGELLEEYRDFNHSKKMISLDVVFESGIKFFGISPKVIMSKWKNREVVRARMMIMCFMRDNKFSITQVADFFKMDHTSVTHARRTISRLINEEEHSTIFNNMTNFIKNDIV